jgi:hypothetical protein
MAELEILTHHECKSSPLSSSTDNDHRPGGPLSSVKRHLFTVELLPIDKEEVGYQACFVCWQREFEIREPALFAYL